MSAPDPAASIAVALATMFSRLAATPGEHVPLQQALGRTLAAEIVSPIDLPPWDNAAMDGYACRAADIAAADESTPVRLPVAETIAAGAFASRELRAGEAMRIMTGAPVPTGADSVIRVEDTDGGASEVTIRDSRDTRGNIRSRGGDVRAGTVVLRAGHRITPAEIALLAAIGQATVPVHRVPRIAILSSGDELTTVEHAEDLRSGTRIVSANSYSLAAIVHEAGGEPLDMGVVRDDLKAVTDAVRNASGCDLLVTSGGISVGGFDYTRAAVEALGGEILFWRVPMRPGYNSAFGSVAGKMWLGVPGNPVSALVAGEVLLRPVVRHLCGSRAPLRASRTVVAGETMKGARGATVFLRVRLESRPGEMPLAHLSGPQGSAVISSSAAADALAIIPPGPATVEAGGRIEALILRDEAGT